jgi:uncharacterized phiE125 gp8 family phage protein
MEFQYNITLSTPKPGSQVVDLDMAKLNSEIEHDLRDGLLNVLLDAAVRDAEQYTGLSILERENCVIEINRWPDDYYMEIPFGPIREIKSITYFDSDGAEQTLDAANYQVLQKWGDTTRKYLKFTFSNEPALDSDKYFPITINVDAGFENTEMPAEIKSAVLMRFSHKELYREGVPETKSRMFNAVLRPYKY